MRSGDIIPLTSEEHRDLAREIRDISTRITELEKLITSVYGPSSKVSFSFLRVLDALERLRGDRAAAKEPE